jgi:hypothetical protein
VAIVKAKYTKSTGGAKASIRYIQHRPGKDGTKINRTLFGIDGAMGRWQAYRMIDAAEKGSVFFRFVISPDPKQEDTQHDLRLREVTEKTMDTLEERIHKQVSWVAAVHADHAPHRHVHVLAVVAGRLNAQDFESLRQAATAASVSQRMQADQVLRAKEREREEAQWVPQY